MTWECMLYTVGSLILSSERRSSNQTGKKLNRNFRNCFKERQRQICSSSLSQGEIWRCGVQCEYGSEFRQVSGVAHVAQTLGHLENMREIYEGSARQMVQLGVAINFLKALELLWEACVVFSVAFNAAKNHGDSSINVWARALVKGKMTNIHLLAIYVLEAHTGEL